MIYRLIVDFYVMFCKPCSINHLVDLLCRNLSKVFTSAGVFPTAPDTISGRANDNIFSLLQYRVWAQLARIAFDSLDQFCAVLCFLVPAVHLNDGMFLYQHLEYFQTNDDLFSSTEVRLLLTRLIACSVFVGRKSVNGRLKVSFQ